MGKVQPFCKKVSADPQFQSLIIGLILMTAIVMGLETSPRLVDYYGAWFDVFFWMVQFLFCFEIIVRLGAFAPRVQEFFKEGWNRFDFVVVALSLMPFAGPFALIARFARILRVARLVSSSSHLREFIRKIGDAVDIMLQAMMVGAVFYYIYAVAGFYLFSTVDSSRWGSLSTVLLTLLKLATFQEVSETLNGLDSVAGFLFVVSFLFLNFVLFVNLIAATTVDHLNDRERLNKKAVP